MRVQNKVVLITGGTGALGQVVAEQMISEGAHVATTYRFEDDLKRLAESFKKYVFIVRADVTHEEDVVGLFHQVNKKLGMVDVLINLVGGYLPKCDIREVKSKDWNHMMSMNLKSAFLCSRQYLQMLGKATYGRIISIAAMPALKPAAGRGPYAVAKAGVIMLTQTLSEELKGTGVTANAIAPSLLRTKANIDSMQGEDPSKWVTPEAVAEMMIHLCSEKGDAINGAIIPMFGGI